MRCVCCTVGMYCGFAEELSGLNLVADSYRNVDELSKQGSVYAERFSSKMVKYQFRKWHLWTVRFLS